ncbi:hypothetical protein EVAR_91584_1 [Eumeta japonica]|uniref:Uncharacterized protein n=1 Tax=Eumeta variegata TaxID=151549 RepID=A0A4C1XB51_EUMVA|nr:hypothetical protein EVAR_91584_1 [Eumeta japonica]
MDQCGVLKAWIQCEMKSLVKVLSQKREKCDTSHEIGKNSVEFERSPLTVVTTMAPVVYIRPASSSVKYGATILWQMQIRLRRTAMRTSDADRSPRPLLIEGVGVPCLREHVKLSALDVVVAAVTEVVDRLARALRERKEPKAQASECKMNNHGETYLK